MEALTTKDGKTILYENGIAEVVDVKDLELRKADIEAKIKEMETPVPEPSDEELIEFGRVHHPLYQYKRQLQTEKETLLQELDSINNKLK